MTKMLLIGDIHRKWMPYIDILKKHEPERSVQIGDFGWGFGDQYQMQEDVVFLESRMRTYGQKNQYVRGNHDNPDACAVHEFCIPDATYEEDTGIFYLGGADSIDKHHRTQGVDWWPNEELSQRELYDAIDKYEKVKPRIMITHEAPEDVIGLLFPWYRQEFPSRTRQALGSMWYLHKPELWVYGHWHSTVDRVIDGCRFICLNELQAITLDLETLEVEWH